MKSKVPVFSKILFLLVFLHLARIIIFNRPRDVTKFSVVDDLALIQISLVFLTALFLLLNLGKTYIALRYYFNTPARWFLLIYISGIASTLWSRMPAYTFYRSSEALILIIAILTAIYWIEDEYTVSKSILSFSTIIIIMGLIGVVRLLGFRSELAMWHSNSYTAVAAMSLSFCFGFLLEREKEEIVPKYSVHFLFFLIVLILGTSSGSFLAVTAGLISAVLINRRFRTLISIMLILLVIVAFIGLNSLINQTIFYGKTEAIVNNLNGREYIWNLYWNIFKENPILGEGFSVTARMNRMLATTNTHNSFLAIATGMGILGLTFFALFLTGIIRLMIRNRGYNTVYSKGAMIALIAGMANSMTISIIGEGWGGSQVILTFFLALFIITSARE